MYSMPAVSLVAAPGRRRATLELAQEIEKRGFSGIYSPSLMDGMGLCEALALVTERIQIGTAIANIYMRHASDYAQAAGTINELSGGRFWFGIGVSHGPTHERLGTRPGRPLADTRRFVEQWRAGALPRDTLPPVVLATLRQRMVELASEIAQGAIWANAARSHMPASLAHLTPEQRSSSEFFIGDMLPTCIDDDRDAAATVMRRTLIGYVMLPNYQNYWIEAGYAEEMEAIRGAIAAGQRDRIPQYMSERWLSDVTLYGSAAQVREGVEAWQANGVKTVILVPSSTTGGQLKAFEELLAAFKS